MHGVYVAAAVSLVSYASVDGSVQHDPERVFFVLQTGHD